jgi:hypothetical protein
VVCLGGLGQIAVQILRALTGATILPTNLRLRDEARRDQGAVTMDQRTASERPQSASGTGGECVSLPKDQRTLRNTFESTRSRSQ